MLKMLPCLTISRREHDNAPDMKSHSAAGKRLPGLFLALAFAAAVPSDAGRPAAPDVIPPADLAGFPAPPKDAHPKIDSALWDMVQSRGAVPAAADEPVRIVVEMDPDGAPAGLKADSRRLFRGIEALGGEIECVFDSLNSGPCPRFPNRLLAPGRDVVRIRLPHIPGRRNRDGRRRTERRVRLASLPS